MTKRMKHLRRTEKEQKQFVEFLLSEPITVTYLGQYPNLKLLEEPKVV